MATTNFCCFHRKISQKICFKNSKNEKIKNNKVKIKKSDKFQNKINKNKHCDELKMGKSK